MKKISLCLATLCLFSVFLTGCGSEEPKPEEQKQQHEKMQAADEGKNK